MKEKICKKEECGVKEVDRYQCLWVRRYYSEEANIGKLYRLLNTDYKLDSGTPVSLAAAMGWRSICMNCVWQLKRCSLQIATIFSIFVQVRDIEVMWWWRFQ